MVKSTRRKTTPRRSPKLTFAPADASRWDDVVRLFGERGACGGCWCMAWRCSSADFNKHKGPANRAAFQKIVRDGPPPGVLAYAGDEPIGWCAIAPRQVYVRLERSRVLKPIDDQPVWSVSCLFVAREHRRAGVSAKLLDAATKFAKSRGAKIVEGYPVEPYTSDVPAAFAWTGLPASFRKAGFREVARPSRSRPIMRRTLAK
jgi:GNAT superfamily N-acetyltransferase